MFPAATKLMPFRYLRDPQFLTCVVAYFVNRFVFKKIWSTGFVHNHFNDAICLPMFAPIVVWLCRKTRLRTHDDIPQPDELLVMIIIWSIMFEIYLPQHAYWSRWATGDPFDVLWYVIGAMAATGFWRWYYRPQQSTSA